MNGIRPEIVKVCSSGLQKFLLYEKLRVLVALDVRYRQIWSNYNNILLVMQQARRLQMYNKPPKLWKQRTFQSTEENDKS